MFINEVLLINPSYYSSCEDDIEYLYNTKDIKQILKAAEKCEKFHSYFHYEESFFNTILAFISAEKDVKITLLKKAIKISPVNHHAIAMLKEIEASDIENNGMDMVAESAEYSLQELGEPSRPYKTFAEYIKFATENPTLIDIKIPDGENFWNLYEKYLSTSNIEDLKSSLNELEKRHISYHKAAAKIYFAAHLWGKNNNDDAIEKFAIIKAKNLDPDIVID